MEPSSITLIRDLGLPTVLLIFILFGAWRAAIWIGETVVRPLVGKTTTFIDRLEVAVSEMSDTLKTVVMQQGKMVEQVERISAIGCGNYLAGRGGHGANKP